MRTPSKTTNNLWKEKAIARGETVRRLRQELKRQKKRANKWRSDYYHLKRGPKLSKVEHYNYPLELIWLAITMHVHYNVSLRGVSQSLCKIGQLYALKIKRVSHMTIRNWCLKFGLFYLSQPLGRGKYVLISDESIEIGRERLLLLHVVPIGTYSPIRPLTMEDVKVLNLGVQTSWTSEQVVEKIKEKTQGNGIRIAYGISDNCAKLKRAMKQCDIKWIGDCTHEIANVSKFLFQKDEIANKFITKMNVLRGKWTLSKHQLLVPPELRTKNRFNQMFIIHKWAERILTDWQSIDEQAQKELLFVQQNKALIKSMRQCYELIDLFCAIFKHKGIQRNSLEQWNKKVQAYKNKESIGNKASQFIDRMNQYLEKQKAVLPQEEQILCCSDVIESTFGKYKNKNMKMITDDVLKIPGYSSQITLEQVRRAMQQTKTVQLQKWKQDHTTISKLALIKRMKKSAA